MAVWEDSDMRPCGLRSCPRCKCATPAYWWMTATDVCDVCLRIVRAAKGLR